MRIQIAMDAAPGTRRRRRRRGKVDDDVLTEILLHLPPKSIFRSITVSKRWKHLVVDPFFLHTHHKRQLSRGAGALVALFPRSHDPYPPRPPPSQPLLNILSLRPPSGRDFRIKRQIPIENSAISSIPPTDSSSAAITATNYTTSSIL